MLSPQQQRFYRDFGFLHLKGLFAEEVETLAQGFEELFATRTPFELPAEDWLHYHSDPTFTGPKRWILGDFVDSHPKLSWLREDPRVVGIARELLGGEAHYQGSDGNRTNCNVGWHPDLYGAPLEVHFIKMLFYLDPLRADSGALRVIPGTCNWDQAFASTLRETLGPGGAQREYGLAPEEVPCFVLETNPGDLIVNSYRTLHASFHGKPGRRLFTLGFGERPTDDRLRAANPFERSE